MGTTISDEMRQFVDAARRGELGEVVENRVLWAVGDAIDAGRLHGEDGDAAIAHAVRVEMDPDDYAVARLQAQGREVPLAGSVERAVAVMAYLLGDRESELGRSTALSCEDVDALALVLLRAGHRGQAGEWLLAHARADADLGVHEEIAHAHLVDRGDVHADGRLYRPHYDAVSSYLDTLAARDSR